MKQIVIDTDIGTDVDDLIALAYAMKNPSVNIKAVATVYENKQLRAKIARKLENILNMNIPIISGAEKTLGGDSNKWWCGFEYLALTESEFREEFLNSKFPNYDKNDILVCIGPLTNIALQLSDNGNIKNIQEAYFMGNNLESHNFEVDVDAAKTVMAQPWRKYFITKEVSKKITPTREEFESIRGTKLGNFVCESAIRWMDYTNRISTPMYDVLTVSAAVGEDFVKFREEKGNFVSYDVDLRLKDKILEVLK